MSSPEISTASDCRGSETLVFAAAAVLAHRHFVDTFMLMRERNSMIDTCGGLAVKQVAEIATDRCPSSKLWRGYSTELPGGDSSGVMVVLAWTAPVFRNVSTEFHHRGTPGLLHSYSLAEALALT
ncbi:hypothetical protein Acr_28g0014430 [Actinidia rufa]|uniref:Uncharacterized protein n=1 Tax=Actinidia rufa TaxID=165716 RepID=A0A7J0HCF2_9ERIC|nr:hypothetical protein Acr_28g0014430 [Actinidia rufa]